ncbi:response regulator [Pseudodesulfovibrio sp. JC047]|uniref:response regulator n=1 Tax=Pseudodesulfovibrio sp. JC047 TaxID=2683199 RepID=UPI0013D60B28|nr:response regulator [Pseudodesulfovibrio sp. JC047]
MKPRILFVDDEQHIIDGYKAALRKKRKQWDMVFVASSKEAMVIMEADPVQVLVSDVRMPGMDGEALLQTVQQRWPGTLRMVLSGFYDDATSLRLVKSTHRFLAKPCKPAVLAESIERLLKLNSVLTNERLRKLIASLDKLPTLPGLYVQVLKELESEEPSLDRVGEMIEQDPAISAILLKVVNSAFFGLFHTVTSPSRAIALLGMETLKALVLNVTLLDRYAKAEFDGFSLEKLGEHCFRVGNFAKIIASTETDDKDFLEKSFLAGFMHDLGKLMLVESFWEEYKEIITSVRKDNLLLFEEEKKRMGVCHAELGAYLLGIWGIDDEVVTAVRGHHDVDKAVQGFSLPLCVYVANVMDHSLNQYSKKYQYDGFDESLLDAVGLLDRLPVWRAHCLEANTED